MSRTEEIATSSAETLKSESLQKDGLSADGSHIPRNHPSLTSLCSQLLSFFFAFFNRIRKKHINSFQFNFSKVKLQTLIKSF